jgi:hypothetical protein
LSNQCTVVIVVAENWAATEAWWPHGANCGLANEARHVRVHGEVYRERH